jgi:hypothetical protein
MVVVIGTAGNMLGAISFVGLARKADMHLSRYLA